MLQQKEWHSAKFHEVKTTYHSVTKSLYRCLERNSGGCLAQTLIQESHLEQGVQVAFEDLQRGESTTFLGNLFQCFVTCTVNKYFLVFRRNILGSNLCLLSSFLSLGTTEKLGSIFFPLSLQALCFVLSHKSSFSFY